MYFLRETSVLLGVMLGATLAPAGELVGSGSQEGGTGIGSQRFQLEDYKRVIDQYIASLERVIGIAVLINDKTCADQYGTELAEALNRASDLRRAVLALPEPATQKMKRDIEAYILMKKDGVRTLNERLSHEMVRLAEAACYESSRMIDAFEKAYLKSRKKATPSPIAGIRSPNYLRAHRLIERMGTLITRLKELADSINDKSSADRAALQLLTLQTEMNTVRKAYFALLREHRKEVMQALEDSSVLRIFQDQKALDASFGRIVEHEFYGSWQLADALLLAEEGNKP